MNGLSSKILCIFAMLNNCIVNSNIFIYPPKADVISSNDAGIKPFVVGGKFINMEHYKNLSTEPIDGEEWREINGYNGLYLISNLGRVKAISIRKLRGRFYHTQPEKILKQNNKKSGYLHLMLSMNDHRKEYSLHRLVATTFIDNPENKPTVNHIDANKKNNCAINLEWNTVKENTNHAFSNGLIPICKGESHYNAKLSADNVLEIRRMYSSEPLPYPKGFQRIIAEKFNINSKLVWKVVHRKKWKSI